MLVAAGPVIVGNNKRRPKLNLNLLASLAATVLELEAEVSNLPAGLKLKRAQLEAKIAKALARAKAHKDANGKLSQVNLIELNQTLMPLCGAACARPRTCRCWSFSEPRLFPVQLSPVLRHPS